MGSILIVTEIQNGAIREASGELAAFAQQVAGETGQEVNSLVMGKGIEGLASDFGNKGGGKVYMADGDAFENYNAETAAAAIKAAVAASGASLILISNTPSGWDVAPRVAAALDAGFVSDAFQVGVGTYKRRVFNGKIDATVSCSADVTVVSVQPGATGAFEGSTSGSTEALSVDVGETRSKFVKIKQSEGGGVDLTKADIIVSGGRGVGDPEKFPEVIQPLADVLGGAMGASRPVVDAGWLPHEYQVGSSGQVVQPKLYIAAGISGAIQHLVGMKSSNFIIAINKDADAPIFEVADLGVVADLFDIVPALTSAIQAAKG
jgi:electron transfer flavoprotein alpha subunit